MKKSKGDLFVKVVPTLVSIGLGLGAGVLFIILVGLLDPVIGAADIPEGIRLFLFGIFCKGRDAAGNLSFGFNPVHLGNLLFKAMPLILCGLAVAAGMKVGLFNIGVPGQYLISTAVTLILALRIPSSSVSPVFIWIIAFSGGMLSAAFWGMIPGALKACLNINEVLSGILTNWIAANLVTMVFEGSDLRNLTESSKSGLIYKTAVNSVSTPKLGLDRLFPGSQANAGILIAVLFAVLLLLFLERTTKGFALKATGANREAARYAGISDRRALIAAFALSGALAGAGAALYCLSGNTEFYWATYQSLPAVGFNGIPAALLAGNHPVRIIFSSLFLSALEIAGTQLSSFTPYDEHVASLVIAVIVYLSAFGRAIAGFIGKKRKKGEVN